MNPWLLAFLTFFLTAGMAIGIPAGLRTLALKGVPDHSLEANSLTRYRFVIASLALFTIGVFPLGTWLILGNPLLGLSGAFLLPLTAPLMAQAWRRREIGALEESGIAFLHGLTGLCEAGLSFPSALFKLCEMPSSAFTRHLDRRIRPFFNGKPLVECLTQFRTRAPLDRIRDVLILLELAYKRGLPLLALLKRTLPLIEADDDSRKKIASLRATMLIQVSVTFLVPLLLWLALREFQPDLVRSLSGETWFLALSTCCFVWQVLGTVMLWNFCQFL